MGTWMARANEDPSKFLCKRTCNFWIVMGCGQPKNHYAVFQRESHQDFWIQHMNGWRWLLIYLSSQSAQSETAVNPLSTPIFCWYFGVSPGFYWFYSFFKVATKEFSFQSTPNTLLFLSGVTGLFLHVRCAPQQNSQWQFWASVCVCVCIYCTLNFLKGKLPTTAYLTWNIWWWNTHLNAVIPACKFFEVPGFKIVIEGPWIKFEAPRNQNRCFQAPRNYSWIILNFEK